MYKPTGSISFRTDRRNWVMLARYEDKNGKVVQKQRNTGIPGPGNKRKAEAVLNEWLDQLENATRSHGDIALNTTVEELLILLLNHMKTYVKEITYEKYVLIINKIIERFKKVNNWVVGITRHDIKNFLTDMKDHGKTNQHTGDSEPLKAVTVKQYRNVLSMAFDMAIDAGIITVNPAKGIKITTPVGEAKQIRVMCEDELQAFLDFTKKEDPSMYPLIVLGSTLGLRRSEILGLQKRALDLDNRTLSIESTVTKMTSVHYENSTKSVKSQRKLRLSNEHIEFFKSLFAEKEIERQYFKGDYINSDYIITESDGNIYQPDSIYKKTKRLFRKFGRPDMTFHDLRASYLSLLFKSGTDLLTVQKLAGHASAEVTLRHYLNAEEPEEYISTGLKIEIIGGK